MALEKAIEKLEESKIRKVILIGLKISQDHQGLLDQHQLKVK
jgi:hypothetical protein